MQWVRRAGASRTCAYSNPLPGAPRMSSSCSTRSRNSTTAWPPVNELSIEFCSFTRTTPSRGKGVRNMVASPSCGPPVILAMMIMKSAPRAPVMNHFRPLMTYPLPVCLAVVASSEGSDPAPSGSVMAKQDRAPLVSGPRYLSRCSGLATTSRRWVLPSSGAAQCIATGPSME